MQRNENSCESIANADPDSEHKNEAIDSDHSDDVPDVSIIEGCFVDSSDETQNDKENGKSESRTASSKCEIQYHATNKETSLTTDLSPNPSLETISIANRNRSIITITHFVLTYPRWSIVLFVALSALTYPVPTRYERVEKQIQYLQNVVSKESNIYEGCVLEGYQVTEKHMQLLFNGESKRVNMIATRNRLAINTAFTQMSRCYNRTYTAQLALHEWKRLQEIPIPRILVDTSLGSASTSSCSFEDRKKMLSLLHELSGDDDDETFQDLLNDYFAETVDVVQRLTIYSKERSIYDYNYFIGHKLQSVHELFENLTIPHLHLTFHDEDIKINIQRILQTLLDKLRSAIDHIESLGYRLKSFHKSIQAFYLNYIDLYSRFESINAYVRDLIPGSISLPPFFNISEVPIAELMLPDPFSLPELNLDLLRIDATVADIMQSILHMIELILIETRRELSRQLRETILELILRVQEILRLEDYTPPRYIHKPLVTMQEDEVKHLQDLSEKIRAESNLLMNNGKPPAVNLDDSNLSTPELDTKSDASLDGLSGSRFAFLQTTFPPLVVPERIAAFLVWLCRQSLYIECVMQLYRLWKLKRRYERAAQPDLPDVDYISESLLRKDNDDEESRHSWSCQMCRAILFRHLLNTWTVLGAICVPVICLILIFWFPHVKYMCIDSRNGTVLANNILIPTLINHANNNGFSMYASSFASCHIKHRHFCYEKKLEALSLYETDMKRFSLIQKRYNSSKEAIEVLSRCVDLTQLDASFALNCCGLENYDNGSNETCPTIQMKNLCPIDNTRNPPHAFQPVSMSTTDSHCVVDNQNGTRKTFLESPTFQCDKILEQCSLIPCSGVDEQLIRTLTIDADCSAQTYTIQICVFIALAIFHAIMVNVFNALLFSGIKCLWWRFVPSDGFKMLTYINEKGDLLKGTDPDERKAKVAALIRSYELAGRVQCVLAGFFFLLWISTIVFVKKCAAYFSMHH